MIIYQVISINVSSSVVDLDEEYVSKTAEIRLAPVNLETHDILCIPEARRVSSANFDVIIQ